MPIKNCARSGLEVLYKTNPPHGSKLWGQEVSLIQDLCTRGVFNRLYEERGKGYGGILRQSGGRIAGRYSLYQDPPTLGVPCLEAILGSVWSSPARTPLSGRRVLVHLVYVMK